MPHGFLVVDKPAGITSHDVVARVRRVFGIKGVGHTGTLDPFATGVLPVAVGDGTKTIPFLDESIKEYRATLLLGAATDTQDNTGQVVVTGDWQSIGPERVVAVMAGFVGEISQLPPMYSAIKQNGVPLYRLARKGETVERQPRQVTIHSLTIDRLELPEVEFTVRCSRGTYVRTLADDIGRELGCGAHLTALRRTASGPFTLAAAVPFADLVAERSAELVDRLLAPADALAALPRFVLAAGGCRKVRHGIGPVNADLEPGGELPEAAVERLLLLCGARLLAVAETTNGPAAAAERGCRLLRVFAQECPLHSRE